MIWILYFRGPPGMGEGGGRGVGSGWSQLLVLLPPTRLDDMDLYFQGPPGIEEGRGRGVGSEWSQLLILLLRRRLRYRIFIQQQEQ